MAHELGQAHTQMGFELLQPYDNKLWTATALIDQLSKVYQAHWDWLIFIKMAGSPTAGVEYLQQC